MPRAIYNDGGWQRVRGEAEVCVRVEPRVGKWTREVVCDDEGCPVGIAQSVKDRLMVERCTKSWLTGRDALFFASSRKEEVYGGAPRRDKQPPPHFM